MAGDKARPGTHPMLDAIGLPQPLVQALVKPWSYGRIAEKTAAFMQAFAAFSLVRHITLHNWVLYLGAPSVPLGHRGLK